MNKASIVILNWNGIQYIRQFLPLVIEHSKIPDIEIVLVDNCSTDNSIQFVKTDFPDIKIIQLEQNYGFAQGYNKSLKQLDSEYYIILNSDVEVSKTWIEPVLEYMDSNPDVGACMPKLRGYDNRDCFEYSGAAGGFIDKYGYPFCRGRIFESLEKDNGQYDNIENIFWATGACLFVRAQTFWKAGGFDARFFAHMEEIDLCWRMKLNGKKIIYFPFVSVFHVGGGALPKENPHKTYLNFRNNLFLLFKNLPSDKLIKIVLIRLLLDILAAFYHIVNFRLTFFYAIIKAHLNFYITLPYLIRYRKANRLLNNNNFIFPEVLNKSLVFEYFIKKKKTYTEIVN
jgi:GT2 family glycosyltransferase